MVQAGANIEAFLKLDASQFITGVNTAKDSVEALKGVMLSLGNLKISTTQLTKFADAMVEVGANSNAISTGFRNLSEALTLLIPQMSLFTDLANESKSFKTFASGLNSIAEAAQRMTTVAERGYTGIEVLAEVMKIWETGVASVENTLSLTNNQLKMFAQEVNRASSQTKSSTESVVSDFNNMANAFRIYGEGVHTMSQAEAESRAITQMLRKEYGLTGEKLVEVRSQLMQTATATVQYAESLKIAQLNTNTFSNAMNTLTNQVRTNYQWWGTLDGAINTTNSQLKTMTSTVTTFSSELNSTSSKATTSIKNASGEFARLKAEVDQVSESYRVLRINEEGENVTLEKSSVALRQNSEEMLRNAEAKLRAMGYTGELSTLEQRLGNSETEVATKTNQATASIQRQNSAYNQATSSTNRLTSATNGLKNAFNSLKMVGTLVASMMVWNFASSLVNATRETVNAKSEMEGYFKMLNFSKSEIADFNSALDKTVKQFQRINKYSLGETISSIGVEFNLTTQEMKKAMPVVSMITSEYLRAGRNANEASLAVKDILQGEFQRLSRETGVKGDQLKEAGWSGDKTDVMGLLEALDTVGKSRNWDIFVTKANSLNDAVLILQNRFGEWTAEMVNIVQPSILAVFNTLMMFGDSLGAKLEGVWKWINADGIAQSVLKWSGLATAIGLVSTALVHYRTGANLTQMAKMGLLKSITATIFGLNAEATAEYGVRTAIISSVTGIEAQTIANEGRLKSITATITGLKMEEVAQIGTKKAILSSLLALDMEIVKRQGVMVALAERVGISPLLVSAFHLESEAEITTTMATVGLAGAMATLLAVLTPIIIAIGSWAIAVNNSAKAMAKFNELVSKGDDIIKQNRKSVETYTKRQQSLKEELDKTEKGTAKYYRTQDKLRAVNKDLITSNNNLEQSIKAVEKARSSQAKFEEISTDIQIHQEERLTEAYLKMGFTASESMEMANESMREANEGAEQLRETLQKMESASQYTSKKIEEFAQQFEDNDFTDKDRMKDLTQDYLSARDLYMQGLEKSMTDESFFGRLDGYFTMGQATLQMNLDELQIDWETGDADEFWKDFWTKFIGDTGFGGLGAINGIFRELGWDEIWKGLTPFGSTDEFFTNLGNDISNFDFGGWLDSLALDTTWLDEWIDSTFVQPFVTLGDRIIECWNNITTYDYIGEFLKTWGLENFDFNQWAMDSIVNPLGNAIYNGILRIPIVGDFLALFGLVNGDNSGASSKGDDLGNAFKTAIENKIRNIPILGDVLQFLGVIPQAKPTAESNGRGVGQSIDSGVKGGMGNMGSWILQEFNDALSGIGKLGQKAYDTAKGWAEQLWNGVNSILQRASPGFFHDQIQLEFGTDIPNAINESGSTAYSVAQTYAQNIHDGMQSVSQSSIGLDGIASEYQSDAQTIAMYSQMMGVDTTTAFNDMQLAVNTSTSTMSANVTSSYSTMQQKQASLLNNMKTSNTTAYNEMTTKSNQSLLQMRDSTTNVTHQMINAWDHMKVQLVATANALRSESTAHFNELSNTIGSFYRKIQNPANWGSAGSPMASSSAPRPRTGRKIASSFGFSGGSGGSSSLGSTMSVGSLKRKICPNGDCGSLFDGYSATDIIDVATFLGMTDGLHGFGWGNWNRTHYNHIKNTSDRWSMKSPQLLGYINTNADFKVGDFNNGQPKISFGSFQSMAESLFSEIPYKFYYDSSWKGSWLGAIQSGACNCYDGANALIAFANTCGFDGYMQHGTWTDPDGTSYAHVWAVINGMKMDTTGWQNRRSWNPSASAGSPNISSNNSSGREVHIHIDMSNSTNYGMDDLESKIEEGVKKGLREEFNDSLTVVI